MFGRGAAALLCLWRVWRLAAYPQSRSVSSEHLCARCLTLLRFFSRALTPLTATRRYWRLDVEHTIRDIIAQNALHALASVFTSTFISLRMLPYGNTSTARTYLHYTRWPHLHAVATCHAVAALQCKCRIITHNAATRLLYRLHSAPHLRQHTLPARMPFASGGYAATDTSHHLRRATIPSLYSASALVPNKPAPRTFSAVQRIILPFAAVLASTTRVRTPCGRRRAAYATGIPRLFLDTGIWISAHMPPQRSNIHSGGWLDKPHIPTYAKKKKSKTTLLFINISILHGIFIHRGFMTSFIHSKTTLHSLPALHSSKYSAYS